MRCATRKAPGCRCRRGCWRAAPWPARPQQRVCSQPSTRPCTGSGAAVDLLLTLSMVGAVVMAAGIATVTRREEVATDATAAAVFGEVLSTAGVRRLRRREGIPARLLPSLLRSHPHPGSRRRAGQAVTVTTSTAAQWIGQAGGKESGGRPAVRRGCAHLVLRRTWPLTAVRRVQCTAAGGSAAGSGCSGALPGCSGAVASLPRRTSRRRSVIGTPASAARSGSGSCAVAAVTTVPAWRSAAASRSRAFSALSQAAATASAAS